MGRCCGKKTQELSEEDLADLRSIERRVKLDDRPWSGEWFFFLEMMVLVYFVLMAVLMAATGAPKYETNSDNEIEGVHPRYEDDAKKCCDKAAGPGNPWGAWEYSEMCWEMEAAGQWDPPPFTGQCTAPTACRADGSSCATDEFCDFTGGSVGECRSCAGYDSAKACYGGIFQQFPLTGSEDCHACCFPATRRRLAKKKHTPKPKTIWEGFSLHPGIPLGVIAVIMFLCFGFLKLMEKFAKTVLFGTFFAEAVFCLYLGFAGKFEAVRAVVWTIIALAIGIYVAFMRKKIVKAGDCISVAATALLHAVAHGHGLRVDARLGSTGRRAHRRGRRIGEPGQGLGGLGQGFVRHQVRDVRLGGEGGLGLRHVHPRMHLEVDVGVPRHDAGLLRVGMRRAV